MFRPIAFVTTAVTLGLIATCGGDHSGPTSPTTPSQSSLSITINGGNGQQAFVGTALSTPPSVIVRSANGTPATGVAVTFSQVGGRGAITGAAQTTNASGIATLGSWTLGNSAGTDSLTASVAGSASPVVFTATVLPAVLVVSNATDVTNGTMSSPGALVASPGPDGISLREAMTAVNNGKAPFQVTFAPSLANSTIALTSPLPHIIIDGTQVVGLAGADGRPTITLDGNGIQSCCANATIRIVASRVTVSRLRFTHINSGNRAIMVSSGAPAELQSYDAVTITANDFDNDVRADTAWGIVVSTIGPQPTGTITNLTVTKNVFRHFQGDSDGLLMENRGEGSTFSNIDVSDNVFTDNQFGFELAHPDCRRCRFRNVRVLRNTFTGSVVYDVTFGSGPIAGKTSIGNVMENIVVANNSFSSFGASSLGVNAGYDGAVSDTMAALWFVNNTVRGKGNGSGVSLNAASNGGSTRNVLSNVIVAGNTITQVGMGVAANSGSGPTSENQIRGLTIASNVFDGTTHGVFVSASAGVTSVNNRIDTLIVAGNTFIKQTNGIGMRVNAGINGGSGSSVSTIRFYNNVLIESLAGVQIFGGDGGVTNNTITDVHAANNTFYGAVGGFGINAFGNSITGTELRNSIFLASPASAANHSDINAAPAAALLAAYNLTDSPAFVGKSNNFNADPLFVSAATSDFHLQAGSPAIRAGTQTDAPATDLACVVRSGTPDLGAYAFGSTGNHCSITAPVLFRPHR